MRDHIDFLGWRAINSLQQLPATLRHHHHTRRMRYDLFHDPPLIGAWLAQNRVKRRHHRHLECAQQRHVRGAERTPVRLPEREAGQPPPGRLVRHLHPEPLAQGLVDHDQPALVVAGEHAGVQAVEQRVEEAALALGRLPRALLHHERGARLRALVDRGEILAAPLPGPVVHDRAHPGDVALRAA